MCSLFLLFVFVRAILRFSSPGPWSIWPYVLASVVRCPSGVYTFVSKRSSGNTYNFILTKLGRMVYILKVSVEFELERRRSIMSRVMAPCC